MMKRSSGILLHPSSLPNSEGIGTLGASAYHFVDFLATAKQSLWQILPLGPTGYGNSPYQCTSAFAGNPLLISLEKCVQDQYLPKEMLENTPQFSKHTIDFENLSVWKMRLLQSAFEEFQRKATIEKQQQFDHFCQQHQFWLEDYALYTALKVYHNSQSWSEWSTPFRKRDPTALQQWSSTHRREIHFYRFLQFLFFEQWSLLKKYSHQKGIQIVGDIPIFVAHDSADVWANQQWFSLDEEGQLLTVAGVPPDYFSETGQRWGNPLYRWEQLQQTNYQWWKQRIQSLLELVDWLRIDHFRGFEKYWEIPANESTAIHGEWKLGPGVDFFNSISQQLGKLPIIAEDLGLITKEVHDLRNQFQFPGMRVLHFAFSDSAHNSYLPHNYDQNTVVYTGTHDNHTTRGWYQKLAEYERQNIQNYFGTSIHEENISQHLIRLAFSSVARWAIVPLQDLLDLGEEGVMNRPGTEDGNWEWRFTWDQFSNQQATMLARYSEIYGRNLN